MSRKHGLNHELALAAFDKHSEVVETHRRAVEPLGWIERSRLQGWSAQEFHAAGTEADGILHEFEQNYPGEAVRHRDGARSLRTFERIRKTAMVLAVVLVLIVVFRSFWAALLILVIALVANVVARRMIARRASQLAMASGRRAFDAIERLGETPLPGEPTGGVAARTDALYLKTLTEIERMTEMQRRQSEQLMRLQTQQHQEQMQAMDRSMEAQRLALAESRFQSDLAVGPRGVFGSMNTARIRARQDQRLQ